jgi:cysteine sulfinate desulfinase/cysteine desulfurase-like protein
MAIRHPHSLGQEAKTILEEVRRKIADSLKVTRGNRFHILWNRIQQYDYQICG